MLKFIGEWRLQGTWYGQVVHEAKLFPMDVGGGYGMTLLGAS